MFRSIRWTLLFWYALILLATVGGFGTALFQTLRHATDKEIDAKLKINHQALRSAIATTNGTAASVTVNLPPDVRSRFRAMPRTEAYFMVWNAERAVIAASEGAPAREFLVAPARPEPNPRDYPPKKHANDKPWHVERGLFRELNATGPFGTTLVVGQRTEKERERLQAFLLAVIGAGAAALAFGLAGGWLLTARLLAPIRQISDSAVAIAAGRRSQRIDAKRTHNELGQLAQTLNCTFDELQAAIDRQVRFTADASHELRTPLAILLAHAELALKRERSLDRYREGLESCLEAGRRMQSVVEGLLTLSRADSRHVPLSREQVAWDEVVRQSATFLQSLAEEAHVTVELDLAPVTVIGDRDRLAEAVANLFTNAIRYNCEDGYVRVALVAEGLNARLTVQDTGLGIPEGDLPHVFERFYRVDTARSRERGGSGLGLAITRWIIEAHGGAIDLISHEGVGTTVTVQLPRVIEPLPQAPTGS